MPTLDELMKPEAILPMATFMAILMGAWGILTLMTSRTANAEERLRRMVERTKKDQKEIRRQREQERIQEKVAEAAKRLSKTVEPKNKDHLGKLRIDLLNAGFRHPQAVQIFLGMKVLCMLAALAVFTPMILAQVGSNRLGLTYIILCAGAAFYLPGLVVGQKKKKRQEAIFLGLPDALDLMVVCVEAGLGFDAAMRRVTTELMGSCPELCDEINIVNFQIQMGRSRRDALRDLGIRTGVDDVRALAGVIIQAERFGSSIGQALRVQSDAMRTRRRQLAEERAAKTAVKIMLPLVLFIFPGVFVVLVGPAGMKIAETLVK